jgi:hypothetical protein
MFDRSYAVMERLPGRTLNELTYLQPELLEDNMVTIAYQLGMHTTFSYVFGAKDGYQTNYVFDPVSKILTRIDKERFLEMPADPKTTLSDGDSYTQEIAACELTNLKYIPSFRSENSRHKVMYAFRQGFLDKYEDIKYKKAELIGMVSDARETWLKHKPVEDLDEYAQGTKHIISAVGRLIDHDPKSVFDRLLKAKMEIDAKR